MRVWDESQRDLLFNKGMGYFILLSFLIGDNHCFTGFVIHYHTTAFSYSETSSVYLSAINEGQNKPIGQNRPELFHDVECQAWPSRPITMKEPNLGVQTNRFKSAYNIMTQKGVNERKEGIYSI